MPLRIPSAGPDATVPQLQAMELIFGILRGILGAQRAPNTMPHQWRIRIPGFALPLDPHLVIRSNTANYKWGQTLATLSALAGPAERKRELPASPNGTGS